MCAGRSGKTGLLHGKMADLHRQIFKGGKPMKKFLSLVLALVMTMSLVTIGAGATEYTDDDSIQYQEAVDVISAIGIVDGDTNGSFRPTDTLTRQAAAKIICNLLLGPTTASALSADAAPYSDVPTTSQFAGYIAYCQKEGIISGYADGTFKPTNTLTGYAFMKMLLGALGYKSDIEGYTGANWSVAVVKRALGIGLDDGLTSEFTGSKTVTREEAALYVCNMLQADMVSYEDSSTIIVNGTTITSGTTVAKAVDGTNSTSLKNIKNIGHGTKNSYVQFAEQYFSNLTLNDEAGDDFGRPANVWYYKGIKIGTYAQSASASYTESVKLNKIYEDLGMTAKATQTKIYMDGVLVYATDNGGAYNVEKGHDDKLSEITYTSAKVAEYTKDLSKDTDLELDDYNSNVKVSADKSQLAVGNGTLTEAFLDDSDNSVVISIMSVYGGKVSAVKAATSKKDAYVVIDPGTTAPYDDFTKNDKNQYETTDFAEDDVVAYTYSLSAGKIKSMYKMESVEGSLTKKTVEKSLQLGDTTYKYAKQYTFDTDLGSTLTKAEGNLTNNSEYVVYLDANGYAQWIEESTFAVSAYALVLSTTGSNSVASMTSNQAKLLFSDGTKKTVDTSKNYFSGSDAIANNTVVRYKVDSNGEYKLTTLSTKGANDSNGTVSQETTFKITGKSATSANLPNNTQTDSNTVFVIQKNATTNADGTTTPSSSFSVYTGIKNAPKVDSGSAYAFVRDGVAKVVFVLDAVSHNTSSNVTFIAGASRSNLVDATDTEKYYQYNAVVDGNIVTVDVSITASVEGLKTGAKTNTIVNDTDYDDDGLLTIGKQDTKNVSITVDAKGVKKISGSTSEIKLAGAIFSLASDCKIYEIDDSGDITAVTLSDVKTDDKATASYVVDTDNGDITALFIQLPED
jgi:hypothetical protein